MAGAVDVIPAVEYVLGVENIELIPDVSRHVSGADEWSAGRGDIAPVL